MIKPMQLKEGDTVAIVSLSSGLAGESDILWRTRQGIHRLENEFGLKVKVMPPCTQRCNVYSRSPRM
ncbi:hypothetical protein [Staphylococcus cohnii]|uniref:hypothetical protein n=1 Tax=Staphylococcus cohnii TaxID=29382 RepID=UPI0026C96386